MTVGVAGWVMFADLRRGVTRLRGEIDMAIAKVLDSGSYVLGEEGRALEQMVAALCESKYAVGVASGTDAIEIGLRALGVSRGDEVITQANTCVPTVAAIMRAGATPVLCDADLDTAMMDAGSLADAISPATRAVVPVHLYGQCAAMDQLIPLIEQAGVALVEDCAQALGARSRIGMAGAHGQFGALSFYPTKNLGALGDGGALVSCDRELAEQARRIRQYGQVERDRYLDHGVNSRLDELQAAILQVRITRLEEDNMRREQIALRYDEALVDTAVVPLRRLAGHRHVFHLYVVRTPRREAFIRELAQRGVESLIHYPVPIHRHAPYAAHTVRRVSLRNSETLASEVVSLPLYPELTDVEVEHVADSARAAAAC